MRIVLVFVSMLFGLLPALGQEPATKQAYINKSLVRRAFQAMEQGDLKTLNEVFDAKATIHTPQGKTMQRGGPFADLKSTCPMCAALSNRKITIDSLLSDGDLVAVRSTWSGKYSGTFRGTAVADKDISVVYVNIYRIADAKIVDNWYLSDSLFLAEQLGMKLIPAETGK